MKRLKIGVVDTHLLDEGDTLLALVAPVIGSQSMGLHLFSDTQAGQKCLTEMLREFHQDDVKVRAIRLTVLPVETEPTVDFDFEDSSEDHPSA